MSSPWRWDLRHSLCTRELWRMRCKSSLCDIVRLTSITVCACSHHLFLSQLLSHQQYSNLCDAESTGVFTDSDCVQLRLPGPVCPEAGDAPCNRMYRPVDCGGCEYSNQCVANSAGFDADSCDELVPPPDISTTLQEPSPCPETGPYFPCNKRYDPVVCVLDSDEDAEPFLCEYSNLCSAIGALFSEEDCRPTL